MKTTLLISGSLFVFVFFNSSGKQSLGQQTVEPEKVVGRESCVKCHGLESKAWELSSHNQKAWSLLGHPKAAGFARAIGVSDIKGISACTQCHGTQQTLNGQPNVLRGSSCESCHGGAGGPDGWLSKHYDFGVGKSVDDSTSMSELLADRLKETNEHRAERDAACKAAGMYRSENAIAIAKNCLSCHLVPNEDLQKAGHPMSSSFEFVEWTGGEIRHNFLLDATTNNQAPSNWLDEFRNGSGRSLDARKRMMFVAGKLADLEVSLRIRAGVTSTKRGTLGDEVNDRILDIHEDLEKMKIDDLKPILDAIKDVQRITLKETTDNDKSIYRAVADAVAAAANEFMTAHAGGDRLPDDLKVKSKVKGEAYDGK